MSSDNTVDLRAIREAVSDKQALVYRKAADDLATAEQYLIEYWAVAARVMFAKHQQLIRAGFSKEDALKICAEGKLA